MTTLNMITEEVRERLQKMNGTKEEMRAEIMESLLATYHTAETELAPVLMSSFEAGISFALRVQESLGAVNEVLFKEYGISPVHIKELYLIVVETLEEVLEMDIDSIFEELKD
jgi:hypothetical protein